MIFMRMAIALVMLRTVTKSEAAALALGSTCTPLRALSGLSKGLSCTSSAGGPRLAWVAAPPLLPGAMLRCALCPRVGRWSQTAAYSRKRQLFLRGRRDKNGAEGQDDNENDNMLTQYDDNSLRARLGSRLYALYDLVPEGAQGVCDVGTDHGLLALALLAGGKCKRAIGVDRKAEPLKVARANAEEYFQWCEAQGHKRAPEDLELREGEGLAPLAPGEADVVCMAGLGTKVMLEVLRSCRPEVLDGIHHLVLQPYDSRPSFLRDLKLWLEGHEAGFQVQAERIDMVGGRYFITLRASKTAPAAATERSKATERFGGHLLRFCRSDEAKRRVYEGYLTLHKDWLSELLEKRQLTDRQGEDRLLLEAIEQELRELRT